ncbi:hypothetical protein GWI33_007914 [Rhynchophorus ferrugineus]|uniref:Gustatory receptor n=1 Tax=Rhynchophorus ferrugineus TaxID=354439 RepID=A0A834MEJ1_RHYFE|nr:hypothetical protein GWI33_007914 [Rhynchophorus ferrugineus]
MSRVEPIKYFESKVHFARKVLNEKLYEISDPTVFKFIVYLLRYKKLTFCLQIVLGLLHLSGLVHSFYGKFKVFYDLNDIDSAIFKFVDSFSNVLLVLSNTFVTFNIFHGTVLCDVAYYLHYNRFSNKQHEPVFVFSKGMVALHLLTLLPLTINCYVIAFQTGWKFYQYILARDIEYWFFNFVSSGTVAFAQKIKNKFSDINQLLSEIESEFIVTDVVDDPNTIDNITTISKCLEKLEFIKEHHNALCDLLDRFNKAFKAGLVMIVLSINGNILWNVTVLIEFTTEKRLINGMDISVFVSVSYILMILVTCFQAALIAVVGEHLAEEGQATSRICYHLLNKFPYFTENKSAAVIRKEICGLLDQAKSRNVTLNAGGFFSMNWGILGSIGSTVATYSIVIMQFVLK